MKKNQNLQAIRLRVTPEIKQFLHHSFSIVDRINDIMEMKGISQRTLAGRMGKQESEISKWMSGTHNFTLKTIAKLEIALGEAILVEPGSVPKGTNRKRVSV
ncbi:MAG: multiprotein-bridging factor 1 family protein [Bacteroidota bacterium]